MMATSNPSGPLCRALDNTIRAGMGPCRGGFDFSLLFEETILGILPISIAILVVPFRIWRLIHKRRKVVDSWLFLSKLVSVWFLSDISTVAVVEPWGGEKKKMILTRCSRDRLPGYSCSVFKLPRLPSGLSLLSIERMPRLHPMPC